MFINSIADVILDPAMLMFVNKGARNKKNGLVIAWKPMFPMTVLYLRKALFYFICLDFGQCIQTSSHPPNQVSDTQCNNVHIRSIIDTFVCF